MFHVEHFALRTDVPRGTLSQSLRLTGLPLQAAQRQLLPADFLQHTDRDVFGHDQRFHRDDECLFHRKLAEACGVGDAVGVDQPRRHRRSSNLDIFSVLDRTDGCGHFARPCRKKSC